MDSGTLMSLARAATSPASGGSASIHRCSLTVVRTSNSTSIGHAFAPAAEAAHAKTWLQVCKPNSVFSVLANRGGSHFSGRRIAPTLVRPTREFDPAVGGTRSEQLLLSYLALLRGGLSCPRDHSRGGELLPRLFTLTSRPGPRTGGRPVGRYVLCDTLRSRPFTRAGPPLFAGHPALWSSDFPHPAWGGTRLPDLQS